MDNIDTIYYINLEHRVDRNKEILDCMNDLGVPSEKLQRINAVYENYMGLLGCVKSHILTLETFIASDANICMVLEDDFQYKNKETFWSDISNIFDTKLNFDVVQLSYNHNFLPELFFVVKDTEHPFLKKAQKTISTSSYIITKEFAPKLLENFKESANLLSMYGLINDKAYALDVYWHILQEKSNWYVIYPSIGFQRGSYSDICKSYMEYNV